MSDNFFDKYSHICDSYKTAYMNFILYDKRIKHLKNWIYASDIIVTLTSCSAVAAWGFFKAPGGASIWSFILGIGTILSILKTSLKWSEQLEKCAKQRAGYSNLYFDLKIIFDHSKIKKNVLEEDWNIYLKSSEKFKELAISDEQFSDKEIAAAQKVVNKRLANLACE